MTNITSKEILARLLAQENIDVVHQNTETAAFDVVNRVLTLPMWEEMENFTYDHLVGHEVGHALFTPADGWMDEVKERGMAFKTFLNVVEDARIEKLIQRRFPGLRRSFVKSYQKMLADDFFGADVDTINDTYELIDRLNVLFKCGESAGVRIDDDEQVWVEKLRDLESFDDALATAIELFELAKQKQNEKPEGDNGRNDDDQETTDEETDADSDEFGSGSGDESDDESKSDDSSGTGTPDQSEDLTGGSGDADRDPVAQTDDALEAAIRDNHSQMTEHTVRNIKVDVDAFDGVIVDWKQIASHFSDITYGLDLFKKFQVNNKKQINYLVKEFEMKKRAAEYARTSTAKSGVIDTVKMNNYRFSDDIFSRVNVVPAGKSHGLLLFVDWSGSMYSVFEQTMHQLMNIVLFCRQVNIPFRVYGFTDRWQSREQYKIAVNQACTEERFALLELFSDQMNRQQFQKACAIALILAKYNQRNWMPREEYYEYKNKMPHVKSQFGLGGTPLDSAVLSAIKVHKDFQSEKRLDIVNSIFLTDGEGNGMCYKNERNWIDFMDTRWGRSKTYVTVNHKRYVLSQRSQTDTLMQMYRDMTGANLIGIRIMERRLTLSDVTTAAQCGWGEADEIKKTLRKEKWFAVEREGYSKNFLIMSDSMVTANGQIDVAEDATKAKIKTAFSKSMGKKLTSRKMLTEFIEMIA